ncbi:MAG: ABC transporter ATP-binding protein [Cyanobacteria bacterium P01_A01_bin.123]
MQLKLQRVGLKAPVGIGQAIDDLSFEVASGEHITIIGPSGSGKTALLRLLSRLIEPSNGKIQFEGRNFQDWPVIELRQHITFVGQTPRLLGMDVQTALQYPLQLQKVPLLEQPQRVHTLCEKLEMPKSWLDRTARDLSPGQQQIVAIARSLILRPKVLLLDGPLATLDSGQLLRLLTALKQFIPAITVILTSHDPDGMADFSDRYLVLHQGKLQQDTVAAVCDREALKQWLKQTAMRESEAWQ